MIALLSALLAASIHAGPPQLPGEGEAQTPAQPLADVGLSWSGAEACTELDELGARVGEFAPQLRVAAPGQPARVAVDIRVAPANGTAWTVEVELRVPEAPNERRVFEAESCTVAVEAAALVVAVAVDPIAVVEEIETARAQAEQAPEPEPEPAPLPEPEPEPLPEPEPEPLQPEPVPGDLGLVLPSAPASGPAQGGARLGIAMLGGGGYGPMAQGVGNLGLRLAVLGEHWRAELRGLWFPPVTSSFPGGTVSADGFSVDARGCGVLTPGSIEIPLCGGLAGGLTRATEQGSATQPLFQLELGVGIAWAPIDRLAIGVELEGTGQLASGGFAVGGQTVLANIPVGVRSLAGIELRLP